jgi:1,4-alpha-glucan branching enzyme
MKKSYAKKGNVCKVTFELPTDIEAEEVAVLGEFNNWTADANLLKKAKKGGFSTTVSLEAGQSYRFRYLLDGGRWENDPEADAYLPNTFGTTDSVITL